MPLAAANTLQEAELRFLESLRSQYEENGYTFTIHPSKSDLPPFLASYQPDAIATKPDHNIAIEVKSRAMSSDQLTLQSIRKLFEGHPNWQLTVAYAGTDPYYGGSLPVIDKASVLSRVREARELVTEGHLRPAFVMAWSLLEAGLNSASPEADKRPRTPGTVVQTLAMNGHISPEAESELRQLIQLRNRIVHGDVTAEPTEADVHLVLSAVASTLG
jgi:REase_AHJR-like